MTAGENLTDDQPWPDPRAAVDAGETIPVTPAIFGGGTGWRCIVCGGPIADTLARLGSTRCHDCRTANSIWTRTVEV
jgi:hypothetical protein